MGTQAPTDLKVPVAVRPAEIPAAPLSNLRTSRTPRAAYLSLGGVLLALHLLYYARLLGFDAVDDAYISFRYAVNWVHGFGPVFNAGERVEGYTNFLWMALLAAGSRLGLSLPPLSILLGAVLAVATLGLLWIVADGAARGVAPLAVLLLAGDGSFALWSVSGMETALFAFLVLAGAVLLAHEVRQGGFPFSGLVFALAATTRPEGVLVFGLSVAYHAACRLAGRQHPMDRAALGRILLFVSVFGTYFAWRYQYYGFLLPNTFYAKVDIANAGDAQVGRGLAHLLTFLAVHYGLLLPALLALPFVARLADLVRHRRMTRDRRDEGSSGIGTGVMPDGYCLLIVIVYTAYVVFVGGDWSIGRFFVPILPFAYLLAARGICWLLDLDAALVPGRRALVSAVILPLIVVILFAANVYRSSYGGERELYALPFEVRLANEARKAAGEWLRRNAAPDAVVAVDAAGQIPYYSGLRALDMYGLNDPYLAHREVELGKGTPGHEKMDLDYVLGRRPDYVVIYGTLLNAFPNLYARVDDWTTDVAFARYLSVYRRRPGW